MPSGTGGSESSTPTAQPLSDFSVDLDYNRRILSVPPKVHGASSNDEDSTPDAAVVEGPKLIVNDSWSPTFCMETADVVQGHSDARHSQVETVPAEETFDLPVVPQFPPLTAAIETQSTVKTLPAPIVTDVLANDERMESDEDGIVKNTSDVSLNAVISTYEDGLSHAQSCTGRSGCPIANVDVDMDAAVNPADLCTVDECAALGSALLHSRPRMWIKDTSSRSPCGGDSDISGFILDMDSVDHKPSSVANCMRGNDNKATRTSSRRTSAGLRDLRRTDRMTPQELFEGRCKRCVMCLKPDCGKCASCLRFLRMPAWQRGVCFRKMCLNISSYKKAQIAVGFPDGWMFYFTREYQNLKDELIIISPEQSYFRSVDAAVKVAIGGWLSCASELKRDFHAHIGEPFFVNDGMTRQEVKTKSTPSKKRARRSSAVAKRELSSSKEIGSRVYCKFSNGSYYWGGIVDKRKDACGKYHYAVRFEDGDFLDHVSDSDDVADEGNMYTESEYHDRVGVYPPEKKSSVPQPNIPNEDARLTPAELYEGRCKACSSCTKKDCSRCASCINNSNKVAERFQCCLRKMCRLIHKDVKKQIAPGLPVGWNFASGIGSGVTLISPCGHEYNSVQTALDRCRGQVKDVEAAKVEFEAHVGGSLLWKDDSHVLVGKEYCQEWTDVRGMNKIIYGKITSCERDSLDENHSIFTVTYNEESIIGVARMRPFGEWNIEPTSTMSLEWALGGCLTYTSKHESFVIEEPLASVPSRRWLTPDMRTEELVMGPDGNELPRLILVWNAYQLVFSVGPSTVPNAGFGVFVQCSSLVPTCNSLILRRGEMLDLGVYAPFRQEDLKEECVFLVKNFIMGLKCEEWTFEAGPTRMSSQFDITDDWTGDLHSIAAQHIPAYVNECPIEEKPLVHAEHDPEGVVHYMLGARISDLTIPADGSMLELFINYGPNYESVRIRKNYSFLPPENQQSHAKSVHQENAEYLEEISGYQRAEVTSCMKFVSKIVETGTLPEEFLLNALCVAVALRHRGRVLMDGIGACSRLSVGFSEVVEQFHAVVATLLARKNDPILSELGAAGQDVPFLSELSSAVMKDSAPSEVQRIVSLFNRC